MATNGKLKIFCGIEGGASSSNLVLINEDGEQLCWFEGPSTNYLLEGLEECQKRLHTMIGQAKEKANIPKDFTLESLGLCMSGCEQEEGNDMFKSEFLKKYPLDAKTCIVASDTFGSVFTVNPNGGLVLIAGTGSNALVINSDGSTGRCGGWGHLLGDEASAIWVSLKACKIVFDTEDNLDPSPFSIECAKNVMLDHFQVQDKFGLLEHCYVKFNKTYFAQLCRKLAMAAVEKDDPLCKHLFYLAGEALGKSVKALLPKAEKALLTDKNGLPIICVGSVFESWELLKSGFHKGLDNKLEKFVLLRPTKSSALGASYLAARETGFKLPMDFDKHSAILYSYP